MRTRPRGGPPRRAGGGRAGEDPPTARAVSLWTVLCIVAQRPSLPRTRPYLRAPHPSSPRTPGVTRAQQTQSKPAAPMPPRQPQRREAFRGPRGCGGSGGQGRGGRQLHARGAGPLSSGGPRAGWARTPAGGLGAGRPGGGPPARGGSSQRRGRAEKLRPKLRSNSSPQGSGPAAFWPCNSVHPIRLSGKLNRSFTE